MKDFPTIVQAKAIFEQALEDVFILEPDASLDRIEVTKIHSYLVAEAAFLVAAKISGLDRNKAYVLGLLHDYGKLCGDCWGKAKFHGLTGYNKLIEMGYPQIAKISLTHSFINKDFSTEEFSRAYQIEELIKVKTIISNLEYDDYDRLIQLSDLLVNNIDGFCSIKARMLRIQKWYNLCPDDVQRAIGQAEKLRKYFENKSACDIYDLLGIDEVMDDQRTYC